MATRMTLRFSYAPLSLALRLLAHPVSLGALALLLANDRVFRVLWPSWWTGKLGDFAWLIVAPWAAAVVFSLLYGAFCALHRRVWAVLRRSPSRMHWPYAADSLAAPERVQPYPYRAAENLLLAAVFLTGLGFTAVKTVPALHSLATRILAEILGTAPSLVRDPSDLIALPALLIPLALLFHTTRIADGPRPAQPATRLRPAAWHWIALPLAALVLLGDAAAPDRGFQCFEAQDGRILASAGYATYLSEDGGRTWRLSDPGVPLTCSPHAALVDGWQHVDGTREGLAYRYKPGAEIQTSTDGGQTWQTAYTLQGAGEPEQYYILKTREGNPIYEPGPLDALADPATGAVLFAMGQQGVLIHTATGEWQWAQGGAYSPALNFPDRAAFAVLLGPQLYMAALLGLLVYTTLAYARTGGRLRLAVLILGWLGWLLVSIIFPAPASYGYTEIVTVLGILLIGVLVIPLAVEQTFKLARLRHHNASINIPRAALIALGGGLLYFIPYLMWLYGALPTLEIAIIAGLVIAAAAVGAGLALDRVEKSPST